MLGSYRCTWSTHCLTPCLCKQCFATFRAFSQRWLPWSRPFCHLSVYRSCQDQAQRGFTAHSTATGSFAMMPVALQKDASGAGSTKVFKASLGGTELAMTYMSSLPVVECAINTSDDQVIPTSGRFYDQVQQNLCKQHNMNIAGCKANCPSRVTAPFTPTVSMIIFCACSSHWMLCDGAFAPQSSIMSENWKSRQKLRP